MGKSDEFGGDCLDRNSDRVQAALHTDYEDLLKVSTQCPTVGVRL